MAQIFPTKANLMATQKSLSLAKLGYELMDRKRNILVREMMQLVDEAKEVESTINEAYKKAYASLQKANITLGRCSDYARTVPLDETLKVDYKSVMGVEIPLAPICAFVAGAVVYAICSMIGLKSKVIEDFKA